MGSRCALRGQPTRSVATWSCCKREKGAFDRSSYLDEPKGGTIRGSHGCSLAWKSLVLQPSAHGSSTPCPRPRTSQSAKSSWPLDPGCARWWTTSRLMEQVCARSSARRFSRCATYRLMTATLKGLMLRCGELCLLLALPNGRDAPRRFDWTRTCKMSIDCAAH